MNAMPARITQGGRLVIPAPFRKSLHLADGEVVMLKMKGNVLQVMTMDDVLNGVQACCSRVLGSSSAADELIAERRREAAKELED